MHGHTHAWTYTYTHTHSNTRMHTHTLTQACTHTHTNAHTHILTHKHTYKRTNTHTHTHASWSHRLRSVGYQTTQDVHLWWGHAVDGAHAGTGHHAVKVLVHRTALILLLHPRTLREEAQQ